MKQIYSAALAVLATLGLAASAQAQEVYGQAGTLGAGAGVAWSFNSWAGVHAEVAGLGFSHTLNINGNDYRGHLSLAQGGLYADLFPFSSSGFRVTLGALINDDKLTAHAVPNANGNYKVGSDFVPAVGAAPEATASLPHVMPYLGVGYGHKPVTKGFGVTFDLGVAYGKPHTSYSLPAIYTLFTTQQNINQQEADITSKVERYKWYPVVQLGVTYRF